MFTALRFLATTIIAVIALIATPLSVAQASSRPAAAKNLKVSVTMTSATMSWSRASRATAYKVCLMTSGSTRKCYRKSAKSSSTKATITGLKPTGGKDYYFKVYSYKGSAISTSSKKSFDLAPGIATNVKATPTTSSATISWQKAPQVSSYAVCLTTNSTASKCYRTSAKSKANKVTFTRLKPTGGKDYYFRVYSYNGSTRAQSVQGSFDLGTTTTAPAVSLTAPTGVRISPTFDAATVSWTPVAGADSYQVCLLTNGTTTTCYRKSAKSAATSTTFTGLVPTGGGDYFVTVTAFDRNGSKTSGKIAFDLPTGTLINLSVKDVDTSWIDFDWPDTVNADSYQLQIATDESMTKELRSFPTKASALRVYALSPGNTYYFRARPMNGAVIGDYNEVASWKLTTAAFSARVITYNLCGQDKCLNSTNGIKPWSVRKAIAGEIVRSASPDVVATQESTTKDTAFGTELPGFALGSYYSAKSLFYRTAKFDKTDSGIITLSSTTRRYAVWAELKDKQTRSKVIVANAHLEPYKGKIYDDMRKAQIKVLIARIAAENPENLPVVYAGDYNSNDSNTNQTKYPGGYNAPREAFAAVGIPDTFDTSLAKVNADYNSANQAIVKPYRYGDHVDHVYVDPQIQATHWEVLIRLNGTNYATPFATDHNPILTALMVPGRG